MIEEIPKERFRFLVENDLIVDGTSGGLLLGPSHDDGHLLVITEQFNIYYLYAYVEGWEYLMKPSKTKMHLEELKIINKPINVGFKEYEIPENISILDCRDKIINGVREKTYLLISLPPYSQFIVNKRSTKKYLDRLEQLNRM